MNRTSNSRAAATTRPRFAGSLVLAGILIASACSSSNGPLPATPSATVRGLPDGALAPLSASTLPAFALDRGDNAQLDGWLDTALTIDGQPVRAVYIGEPDHFVAAKYDTQLAVIDALLERGFTHIALEMGAHDSRHVERFIQSGDADQLERVELYRDAERLVEGSTGTIFADNERRFLSELRALIVEHGVLDQVRLRGFDLEQVPAAAARHAREVLGDVTGFDAERATIDAIARDGLAAAFDASLGVVESLDGRWDELDAALGPGQSDHLRSALYDHAASLNYAKAMTAAGVSSVGRAEVQQRREQFMSERLRAHVANAPADARWIVLGHCFHLTHPKADLYWGAKGDDLEHWRSAGADLSAELDDRVLVLWMLFGSGTRQPPGRPPERFEPLPQSVEAKLASIGGALTLPVQAAGSALDRAALDGDVSFRINGHAAHGDLENAVDAILFVSP